MKTTTINSTYLVLIIIGLFSTAFSIGISDMQSKISALNPEISKLKNQKNKTERNETIMTSSSSKTKETSMTKQFENSDCDLITEGPICLFNEDRIFLPFASPKGLVGYWNFDNIRPLDNSGNRNHGEGVQKSGPAFGGFGSSAFFSGGEFITIPSSPSFESSDFTITFWFQVVQDFLSGRGTRNCPLIQRGSDDLFTKTFQRSPALYYDRKEKKLQVYIKTANEESTQGEKLISNAKIPIQRWLHIAIQKSNNKMKLYINGILDNQVVLISTPELIKGPLYIGNVPWMKDECDFPIYMDELRYYNIPLDEDIIQAEASPILGGIEPSFLQLGCMNCSLKDASQSCIEGYHLCTSIELHTGGYQIARSVGWLNSNSHIWTHGALKTPDDFDKVKGLALCCAELK